MSTAEKKSWSMLAITAMVILGLIGSLVGAEYFGGVDISGKVTGMGGPSLSTSFESCAPDLEDALADIDAGYDVETSDDLEEMSDADAQGWQGEYMDSFADYMLCLIDATPGVWGSEAFVDSQDDLIEADYGRLAYLGIALYSVTDEDIAVALDIMKPGFWDSPTDTRQIQGGSARDLGDFLGTPLGRFLKCAAGALGLTSLVDLINYFRSNGINPKTCFKSAHCRKLMLKLLKRWGRVLLGWWGVAILVLEIGWCALEFLEE